MIDQLDESLLVTKAKLTQINVMGVSKMHGFPNKAVKPILEGMTAKIEKEEGIQAAAAWRKAISENKSISDQQKTRSTDQKTNTDLATKK